MREGTQAAGAGEGTLKASKAAILQFPLVIRFLFVCVALRYAGMAMLTAGEKQVCVCGGVCV